MPTLIAKIRPFARIRFVLLTSGQGSPSFCSLTSDHSPLPTVLKRVTRKLGNQLSATKSATSKFLIDNFLPDFAFLNAPPLLFAPAAAAAGRTPPVRVPPWPFLWALTRKHHPRCVPLRPCTLHPYTGRCRMFRYSQCLNHWPAILIRRRYSKLFQERF